MASNPIQYTSRTFQTILNDINSDPELVDKPEWFKRMIAGVGDVMSMQIDAQANNSYLETAFTRDAVRKLCALIGYKLGVITTSYGKLKFYLKDNTIFPVTISAQNLCAVYGAVSSMRFESRLPFTLNETITHVVLTADTDHVAWSNCPYETFDKVQMNGTGLTGVVNGNYYYLYKNGNNVYFATSIQNIKLKRFVAISGGGTYDVKLYTITCDGYQQESKEISNIGTSDGNTAWQEFDLPDKDILSDTLVITINDEQWTLVEDFSNSVSSSKHFMIEYNNDGTSKIIFGNGVYGVIPEALPIYAQYAVGGGSSANISNTGVVNVYAGGDEYIEGVINSTSFNGGTDYESLESTKILAPATLKTRNRFVTVEDGLVLLYSSGYTSIAKIMSNYYGSLSCKVNCVANGGGNLNNEIKSELQQFLIDRSVLGSVDVRVVDTVFVPVNVGITVSLNDGYVLADVVPYIEIAVKLFLTECGREIINMYTSRGLGRTIELINDIFVTAFDNSDVQIQNMLLFLKRDGCREFGDHLYESDLVSIISTCVDGINHLTVDDEIFPVDLAKDQISTVGTITVVEE